MKEIDKATSVDEVRALREGIRKKYNVYHTLDKGRFPAIDYNTSRANYEPLRQSFEEEFYSVRGIHRFDNNIHIPSTNTLALIFSNDSYLPNKKILNTCRSYAEGKSQRVDNNPSLPDIQVKPAHNTKIRKALLISLILPIGFAIYAAIKYLHYPLSPGGLMINKPYNGQTVPRLLTIEGKASNADTVWIVVHPVTRGKKYVSPVEWNKYYIQPPITVDDNGTWKGQIYIGSADKGDIGVRLQIRAFINPDKKYKLLDEFERYLFNSWPKAELSTEAFEVVRGPKEK